MKVYIAQLLCPQRHCVLAVAGEYESDHDAKWLAGELGKRMGALVITGVRKHECGICKSTDLEVDIQATGFATLAEAGAPMAAEKARQLYAAYLKASRN